MASNIKDMTQGRPARLIFAFALPLMVGNVFQQLYIVVDTAVVGRFVGVEALASVGAADWPNWMVLGMVTGFAQGFCILISQRFGAGDMAGMRRNVSHTYALGLALAAVLTLAAHLAARPILTLLGTPDNVMGGAMTYLRISYSGIFVIMAYNVFSSVLRALGDSKSPLYAMIIAAAINVVLDLLFVAVFHWGIAGAAAATLIAQCFSALYCLLVIRRIELLRLSREDFAPDFAIARHLLTLGAPMALQNGIIAVGGLVVQYVINGFGFIVIAGLTATNKIFGLLELAAISYGFSMSTYAGQNLGAGKVDRIRRGMRAALLMAVATSAVISILMLVFGRSILSLFVSGEPDVVQQVLDVAYAYLSILAYMLCILYFLHIYRSALQGMGDTVRPMISGVMELAMRILVVMTLPKVLGELGIFLAEPAAWLGADALLIPSYYLLLRRQKKLLGPNGSQPESLEESASN